MLIKFCATEPEIHWQHHQPLLRPAGASQRADTEGWGSHSPLKDPLNIIRNCWRDRFLSSRPPSIPQVPSALPVPPGWAQRYLGRDSPGCTDWSLSHALLQTENTQTGKLLILQGLFPCLQLLPWLWRCPKGAEGVRAGTLQARGRSQASAERVSVPSISQALKQDKSLPCPSLCSWVLLPASDITRSLFPHFPCFRESR